MVQIPSILPGRGMGALSLRSDAARPTLSRYGGRAAKATGDWQLDHGLALTWVSYPMSISDPTLSFPRCSLATGNERLEK